MSFLTHPRTPHTALAVDIASESVGVAFVYKKQDSLPEIIAEARIPFFLEKAQTTKIIEEAMISALKEALMRVASAAIRKRNDSHWPKHVESAVVALSSPWVVSKLVPVSFIPEKNLKLDHDSIINLLGDEKRNFKHDLDSKYNSEHEISVEITSISANGYEITSSVLKKGIPTEIGFMLGASDKEIIRKIEEEIVRTFGVKRGMSLVSYMFPFHKVFSKAFQNLHSALFIKMTGEITDLLMTGKRHPLGSTSIPFGPATIARRIKTELNIPLAVAESYLSLFAASALDMPTMRAIDKILVSIEEDWKKLWDGVTRDILTANNTPQTVVLLVEPSYAGISKTIVETVLPGKEIILIRKEHGFTKEIVKNGGKDDGLSVLASFSHFID